MEKSTFITIALVVLVAVASLAVRFSLPTGYYIAQSGNQLTVSTSGRGDVFSTYPSGIACGAACSEIYPAGTLVTLKAQPKHGSSFVEWSGACSGAEPLCKVNMDAAQSVSATFSSPSAPQAPKPTPLPSQSPISADDFGSAAQGSVTQKYQIVGGQAKISPQMHCCIDPRYNSEYALENPCRKGFIDQGVQEDCNKLAVQLRNERKEQRPVYNPPTQQPVPPMVSPVIKDLEDLKKMICPGYGNKGKIENIQPMGGRGRRFVEDAG